MTPLRIAVTGAGGQLGGDVVDTFTGAGHEVTALQRADCDIRDADAVARALDAAAPDALVNCAAWTYVDGAEGNPDAAFAVNATGPGVLASACAARNMLLLHVSTDYVFDGTATAPMDEATPPAPLSVYGKSKLAGEDAVRELAPRHQIVRTSWLFGRDGPNFVLTMRSLAREGRELRVVADQRGSPTWTGHLAPALLRLLQHAAPGTYHLTASGVTSWHGFAEAALAASGMTVPVTAITSAAYPRPAPRPMYSVLDNRAWRALGEPPLPSWRDGLAAYLHQLNSRAKLRAASP